MESKEVVEVIDVTVKINNQAPFFTYVVGNVVTHDLTLLIPKGVCDINLMLEELESAEYLDQAIQFFAGTGIAKVPIEPPPEFSISGDRKTCTLTDNNPGGSTQTFRYFLSVMHLGQIISDDPTIINEPDSDALPRLEQRKGFSSRSRDAAPATA